MSDQTVTLVTGGAGFIGSHLTRRLVSEGHQLIVLDDLSSGSMSNLSKEVEFIEGCVTDKSIVASLVDRVDQIFHLAAIASVQASRDSWVKSHHVNQSATVNFLEAISESLNTPTMTFVSSAAIYGNAENLPIDEETSKDPQSAYAADKLSSEYHLRVGAKTRQIPASVIRPFNVYGPGQNPSSPYSGVISIFADRLTKGLPVTIYGDGQQSRDFIFVADIVEFLIQASRVADFEAPAFNGCTGRSITVLELAEMIGEILGIKPEIKFADERRGEVRHSLGDNNKSRQILGHVPQYDLRTGLTELLKSIH